MLVAGRPQHWHEFWRRHTNSGAALDRFYEHGADCFPCQEAVDGSFIAAKGGEPNKLRELRAKRCAEEIAMRCCERTVTQPMITAFEGEHSFFACRHDRGFDRGFNRFESRIAEDRFAALFAASPA